MKYFAFALLAVLSVGAVQANPVQRTLRSEVDVLISILRFDEVLDLFRFYAENSAEVRDIDAYLRSPGFGAAWQVIISTPELLDTFNWAFERGVDIVGFLNDLAASLGQAQIPRSLPTSRTWNGFVTDMRALVDTELLLTTIGIQVISGGDMTQLFLRLQSEADVIARVMADPAVLAAGAEFRRLGVDVDYILELLGGFLNI